MKTCRAAQTGAIFKRRRDMSGWISIKEKLPFDDAPSDWKGCLCDDFIVLIKSQDMNDGDIVTAYEYSSKGWCYFGGEQSPYAENVTHWRPFPPPPKEKP
jgi:hypothetical protein